MGYTLSDNELTILDRAVEEEEKERLEAWNAGFSSLKSYRLHLIRSEANEEIEEFFEPFKASLLELVEKIHDAQEQAYINSALVLGVTPVQIELGTNPAFQKSANKMLSDVYELSMDVAKAIASYESRSKESFTESLSDLARNI